jgi:hypothetical protein
VLASRNACVKEQELGMTSRRYIIRISSLTDTFGKLLWGKTPVRLCLRKITCLSKKGNFVFNTPGKVWCDFWLKKLGSNGLKIHLM